MNEKPKASWRQALISIAVIVVGTYLIFWILFGGQLYP